MFLNLKQAARKCSQLEFRIFPPDGKRTNSVLIHDKTHGRYKSLYHFRALFHFCKKIWTLLTLRQRLSIAPILEEREDEQGKKLIEPSLASLLSLFFFLIFSLHFFPVLLIKSLWNWTNSRGHCAAGYNIAF